MIANSVVSVPDNSIDISGTGSTNGTTVTKGTATDLLLSVMFANRGTQTLAGTYTVTVQGTNDSTTYTAVTPDKGSLPAATNLSAGVTTVHLANLQYASYRAVVAGTTGPGTFIALFNYQGIQDSIKNTVQ